MAFEDVVANPKSQRRTIVMALDDASRHTRPANRALCRKPGFRAADEETCAPGELYVYIGTKTREGHPIERAGLTDGSLYGGRMLSGGRPVAAENNDFGLGSAGPVYAGRFELVQLGRDGDVSGMSGIELQTESIAKGITRLQRVEDGAWDPRPEHSSDFSFATTGHFEERHPAMNLHSRLWRLRFDDLGHPEAGGSVTILLRGGEGPRMMDNIAIDRHGRILIQENVGKNARLARIWLYGIDSGRLIELEQHNPRWFRRTKPDGTTNPDFLTADEESTGIIDASRMLGDGWFLLSVQAHYDTGDPELVQGG